MNFSISRSINLLAVVVGLLVLASTAYAQVTTGSIGGTVVDKSGQGLVGATVRATHVPSGTQYGISTREDGRYNLQGLRVGGPYMVAVTYVGYTKQEKSQIFIQLSQVAQVDFQMSEEAVEAAEVVVTAERGAIMNPGRTGAATNVSRAQIDRLPTITRRINDITRLVPQAGLTSFGGSFAGQDNRLNNITIDGSYFNNSFGLAGQPGDRTGVSPISLDALEQVQVNIAPFDVRQGNFVGAGVNSVTRSGTNEFSGSAYYQFRDESLVGTEAKGLTFNPGTFKYSQFGVRLGGPIIENKLFFFANFESDALTQPATTFVANKGGETVTGNTTRVLASDLDALSAYLKNSFGYETGGYQGYDAKTPATRFLVKLDYNWDEQNKISLRYTHLDSETDVLVSNSSSLGFGTRRSNLDGLNFANSNYGILENIRSIVAEWNSILSDNMSNKLIVGYNYSDESRSYRGTIFPMVDILSGGSVYTTFGFEPFTPNNELRYDSYQLQNDFTYQMDEHIFTVGLSLEKYHSENVFFPGSQSVYVYNSLADFYTDANGYIADPNRTVSPVTLRRFQVRWANIPGMEKPVQPLKVLYGGLYAQDEWQVMPGLKVTAGLRLDVPMFEETGFRNAQADTLTFRDESGAAVKYKTDKLPDANILWSPRLGVNWDVFGDRSTQVRGGTGVFTARPAYVWISNQIGNTGVLTGFERLDNTTARPFHPDPDHYKPTNVTGAPASSYELALTDPNYKFPQIWRTNIAVDQELPYGLIATGEFIYNKDVNGTYYINANLAAPNATFSGPDTRPRWTGSNRINANVDNAIVLKNQDVGSSWNIAASLERPYADGFFAKAAWSYGESKNTVDPGSIAFGSWNNNQHSGNPNLPGTGFSAYSTGHRVFGLASYRFEYFDMGATVVSLFIESRTIGNGSYVYSGDMNGDGGTSNDLIYVPNNASEITFEQYTASGATFTVQQQVDAWEAFIKQDEYLSSRRGQYAERNGAFLPMVTRADLSISQEIFTNFMDKRNTLEFRADFLNVTNLINKDWGVGQAPVTNSPLIYRSTSAGGVPTFRMRNVGTSLVSQSLQQTLTLDDVFRIQFTLRYTFN